MQGGDKNRVVFVKTDMNKISDSQSSDHHTTCGRRSPGAQGKGNGARYPMAHVPLHQELLWVPTRVPSLW